MTHTDALIAQGLSVSRGPNLVLKDLTFRVAPSESVALSGPSGSGKSTLLAALAGLVRPDGGSVSVGGQILGRSDRQRSRLRLHHLGIVFQGDEFLPELSLLENVALPALLRDKSTRVEDHRADVSDLFDGLGLRGLEDRRPSEVSVGQLQRAAIARAVTGRPAMVLADEPTSALDLAATRDSLQLLLGLAAEFSSAVLLVTHDDAVARLCHRRLYLRDGSLDPVAERIDA